MRAIANSTGSRLVPALRYRNVAAAIDWLCGAFGFERHDIVTAVDGTILHARLMFGNDMILVLPVRSPDGGASRTPEEAGAEMQSCYFVVDDADLHYRHAKASGAEILDITEYDYGGRGYSCRDPEGHIWNFGTYDPRQGQQAVIEHWPPKQPSHWRTVASDLRLRTVAGFRSLGDKITPPVIVAAVVAAVIAAATVGWMLVALPQNAGGGVDKRLTFRSITPAQGTEEAAAQQPAARSQVNTLSLRTVASPPADDALERAARQQAPSPAQVASPTQPASGSQPQSPPRVVSRAFTAIGVQTSESADDKELAERKAEEALRQLHAAQRNAGEAFKQLREASAESAAAPVEPRKQVARSVPDAQAQQLFREQQAAREQFERQQKLARERAAKESAAQLEQQFRQERAAKEAEERARVSAVAPPKEPVHSSHDQKADSQFWDCQPSVATGQIVCNPKKSAPAEAKAPPPAPKPPKATAAAEPAAAPPAPRQQAHEQKADTRLWDCQPRPPTGEVVCRPMGPAASAKQ
jgi:uncharacterized glyoxalase superfamily protein PhnB